MTGDFASSFSADRALRWCRNLSAEVIDAERVLLFNERERFMLTSPAYVFLAQCVDGQRSLESILATSCLPPTQQLRIAAERLFQKGYLTSCAQSDSVELLEHVGVAPMPRGSGPLRIRLHDFSTDASSLVTNSLQTLGLDLRVLEGDSTDAASLDVVLVDDYLDPRLEEFNRRARDREQNWVLLKAFGAVPLVGPVFRGPTGPCWECLATRLKCNRPVERYLSQQHGGGFRLPQLPHSRFGAEIATRLFALSLVQWLHASNCELSDSVLALELRSGKTTRHRVVRRPQCNSCGDPHLVAERMSAPIALQSRPYERGTCRRIVDAQSTLERLRGHVSPLSGALSSLGPVHGAGGSSQTIYAASWFRCPAHDHPSQHDFQRTSLGRGVTPLQAEVSALCEAFERQTAAFQGDEPTRRARADELSSLAIPPEELLNLSERQYLERDAFNMKYASLAQPIPARYDGREISWVPVWSLTHQQRKFVPTSSCFYDCAPASEQAFCPYDSNGDAAGNCLEEAILQGFLELVERDAVSLWWYNRARRPAVDVHSFRSPFCESLLEQHTREGWQLWVLNLTTDLAIPTFVALGTQAAQRRFSIGFGTDLDPRQALERALTEFNQLWELGEHRSIPLDWERLSCQDYLYPDPSRSVTVHSAHDSLDRCDLLEDIAGCVERAGRLGLEVLILDRSRPDVDLRVAKVIVPGLRHFWPRFGPGRLFEAPVRLGWVEQALSEEQLNPIPLLL